LIVRIFRDAALRFSADGATFLAQAIAFNAIFALFPFTLVLVAIFGFFYGSSDSNAEVLRVIDAYAPGMHDLVAANITSAVNTRSLSGTIGLAGLIWSAKNVFGALTYALERSLNVKKSRHVLVDTILAVLLVIVSSLLLVAASAVPVIISIIARLPGIRFFHDATELVTYLASLALIFLISALVYTYLPNRSGGDLRFGFPGAAVTAVGWSIAQVAFAIYTTHTNVLRIYGALAEVFAVLLYVYFLAMIFLFGAHVSAAVERARNPAAK
jgi:membrane protein